MVCLLFMGREGVIRAVISSSGQESTVYVGMVVVSAGTGQLKLLVDGFNF